MAKPSVTLRSGKGSALTYTELDTNFTNLKDATVTLQAGTGGTNVISDLNGSITLVAGTGVSISGDNTAKTVTIGYSESQNIFQNIAVAGQSTVTADGTGDTLTLAAGSNITLTTNATTDTITIASSASGLTDIVNDTTPQLGGPLDLNGKVIYNSATSVGTGVTIWGGPTTASGGYLRVGDVSTGYHIALQPGPTGYIDLGTNNNTAVNISGFLNLDDASAYGSITTGPGDSLILTTNQNSSSGQIKINSGANGNIELTPNGTGKVLIGGKQHTNGPAFGAYANNTLQTITSGSQQKVLFQVEEFDTNSCYTSSTFTPNVEGYYQLNSEVRLDGSSGTGEIMIVLYKNGAEHKRGTNQQGTSIATNFFAQQVNALVYANGTTDYFEIYVQQTSGSSMSVTAVNSPAITWFNGAMVRGA